MTSTPKSVLSETLQPLLLAKASLRKEPKGAVLFRRGEPSLGVFLVRTGSISLRLESKKNEAILDRTIMRDGIVGLPATLSGGRYSLTALTLEESELAFVERDALLELVKNTPAIGFEILRVLGEEVVEMREILASIPGAADPNSDLDCDGEARVA